MQAAYTQGHRRLGVPGTSVGLVGWFLYQSVVLLFHVMFSVSLKNVSFQGLFGFFFFNF